MDSNSENSSDNSSVKFDTIINENENQNQNNVTLSIDDFKTVLNVLVVVSKRGGFLLEEYKTVGELFDRLKLLAN
jgi:hypothetical protein